MDTNTLVTSEWTFSVIYCTEKNMLLLEKSCPLVNEFVLTTEKLLAKNVGM